MSKSKERAQKRLADKRKEDEQEQAKAEEHREEAPEETSEARSETPEGVGEKPDEPVQAEEPKPSNFAEAAAKVEAAGKDPVAPVEPVTTQSRGVIPDAFGNNVKGERICKNCGIKESETLKKNPRYSFCKGLCVNCYGKLERKNVKPGDMNPEQIQEKIDYYSALLTQKRTVGQPQPAGQPQTDGAQGRVEESATGHVTIVTEKATIETHGANVDVKADELAVVETE